MKAQRAAAVGFLVSCLACSSCAEDFRIVYATEEPELQLSAELAVAAEDGTFTAAVSLDRLPDSGLSAAEFAIAYDAAAFSITDVTLLYDTGAQDAEYFLNPDLAGTVFQYEDRGGKLWVRWATALEDADYWLKEERVLFTVSGKLTDKVPPGTRTELRIVPAAESEDAQITAGWMDADGTAHYCSTTVTHGAVCMPVDETGATLYGDIDLDGTRTISDAVLLHRVIAQELSLSAAAYANADCEFDGLLTVSDVTLMLRYLSGEADAIALGKH